MLSLNALNYRYSRTGWWRSPAHCSPGGVSAWPAVFDRSLPPVIRHSETQEHRRRDGVIQHGSIVQWTTDITDFFFFNFKALQYLQLCTITGLSVSPGVEGVQNNFQTTRADENVSSVRRYGGEAEPVGEEEREFDSEEGGQLDPFHSGRSE